MNKFSTAALETEKAYALLKKKKKRKAESLIEEIYDRYPDYPVGRINYADLMLRKKRWQEIPTILEGLTPKTPQEKRGVAVVWGHYFLFSDQRKEAEAQYVEAVKADPLHPSILYLEKKLFRNQFLSLTLRVVKKWFLKYVRRC